MDKNFIREFIENMFRENDVDCKLIFREEAFNDEPNGLICYDPDINQIEVYLPMFQQLEPNGEITVEEKLIFFTALGIGYVQDYKIGNCFKKYVALQDSYRSDLTSDEKYDLYKKLYKLQFKLQKSAWLIGQNYIQEELLDKYRFIAMRNLDFIKAQMKERIQPEFPDREIEFIKI